MASKKQMSASSSDEDDSSFERFVAQRPPSLKRKQRDGEEEESESESEDSSSDSEEEEEEKAKSPATKSVSHPSQAQQCTQQEKNESESEETSDSEEESPATKSVSHPSQTQQCTEEEKKESESEDSSSDSEEEEEEEEKAKSPATKSISHPSQAQQCTQEEKKESVPDSSEQSSSSEEKEEEEKEHKEEEEDAKSPVENSESLGPETKRSKAKWVPVAGPSPSTTTSAVQRLWSLEDELVLLHALSHYHNTYNRLPPSKEYDSFLTAITGSLSFPATEKQLYNKIRTWKTNYGQRKIMGSKAKSLNPHEKVVFKICAKLFEDASCSKTKSVGSCDAIYLRELIGRKKLPAWFSTVEDVVQQLGESRAHDLERKAKQLSIDAMKLHAMEQQLMADVFDVLADEMAGHA